MLADLTGKVLKRLDRHGKRRWPGGEIALTDRWAAWSVKRATYDEPTGPGSVFVKKLEPTPRAIVNVSSHQARRAVDAALGHAPEARDVTSGID